jgi:hypothetical protein
MRIAPTRPSRGSSKASRCGRIVAGASITLLAAASSASAAGCAATTTAKVFSKYGDTADYRLAPGGNFESALTGWTLTGASVIAGNEIFAVGSNTDTKSLALSATGKVVSAPFCVGIEHPTFRIVARKTSGTWATLLVKIRATDSAGHVNETTIAGLNGSNYTKWTISPSMQLATALPLWAAGQTTNVQIVLDPEDSGGAWQVDDIYIDPLRRT